MKYFDVSKLETLEDLKKAYKKLAVKFHPDNGGSETAMKEINAEYTELFEKLKNKHRAADGTRYEKKTETKETAAEFINIIDELIKLYGIGIEVCGSWIWVTGDTKPHKEKLKELRFRWSKNKNAWYFHSEPYRKKSKKTLSLDEIRDLYGSERYETAQKAIS